MKLLDTLSTNFSVDLFEKGKIHPMYTEIVSERKTFQTYKLKNHHKPALSNSIVEIKCIPAFLEPRTNFSKDNNFKKVIHRRIKGYCIELKEFKSAEEYMKFRMGSKHYARIRSQLKRLETCYDINCSVYYGSISKEIYELLWQYLKQFLKERFIQRGETFDPGTNLGLLEKNCFQMILDKKASLHVIYDDGIPIDICLNFHFQDITNHALRCYDIAYSKFSLGNIDLFKQLDWCLKNNFKIFDLMWGNLDYKNFWSNKTYLLTHHFFYNTNSLWPLAFIKIKLKLYQLKDYLVLKRAIWDKKTYKKKSQDDFIVEEVLHFEPPIDISHNLKLIPKIEHPLWLRQGICNFQYKFKEHTKTISVFKVNDPLNSFLVKGNNNAILLTKKNDID